MPSGRVPVESSARMRLAGAPVALASERVAADFRRRAAGYPAAPAA